MLCRNREKTVSRELLIKAGWDKDDYKLHLQLNKYIRYLQPVITQYLVSNKSEIWP